MSYHIVKSISIDKDALKVWITGCVNNDSPRTPRKWGCESLSLILATQGLDAVQLEIFKEYEQGNFQTTGDNKYTRALSNLRSLPEYADYNWRGEPYDVICANRKTHELDALLRRALSMPSIPKPVLREGTVITFNKPVQFTDGTEAQTFTTHIIGRRKEFSVAGRARRVRLSIAALRVAKIVSQETPQK